MTYDSMQFVGQQALVEGPHRQRQLHLGAALDRGGHQQRRASALLRRHGLPCCMNEDRTSRSASTASRRRACGSCRGTAISASLPATCSAAGRSAPFVRLPVGTALGHARQRRSGAGTSTSSKVALPGKKDGQFIYGVKPCVGQRNATTGNYDLLSVSTAYGCTEPYFLIRETYQRRTTMFRYDEFRRPVVCGSWTSTSPRRPRSRITCASRSVSRPSTCFNSPMYDERQLQPDDELRGLRPHQSEHQRPVELPAVHPARVPADLLTATPGTAASLPGRLSPAN